MNFVATVKRCPVGDFGAFRCEVQWEGQKVTGYAPTALGAVRAALTMLEKANTRETT